MIKKVLGIAGALLLLAAFVPGLNAVLVRDTLYVQNFNGEWSTTTPPAGWNIIYDGSVGTSDWYRYTGTISGHAGPLARIYWSPSETGIDRLISPTIDCTENPKVEQVIMRVWHLYDYFNSSYLAQIRGSDDGGSNYSHIILDYIAEGITFGPGDYEDFDITEWALGQNDVRIDFYANGYTYNMDNWYVDDFMMIAQYDSTTGGPGGEADFEMVQIIRPQLQEAAETFKPKCTVLLIEEETPEAAMSPLAVDAKVFCRIKDLATQQNVYEDVFNAFPFEPGYNDVEFKNFTPVGGKTYEALFAVEYAEDPTPENNDKSRKFTVELGIEVDAVEILAPVGEVHKPFAPSCKFQEMLSVETPDAMLWCSIDGTPVDSLAHAFGADEEFTATFGSVQGLADGEHTIKFWATNTKNGNEIGEAQEATFTFVGIAEKPEVSGFNLEVSGRTVNFSLDRASNVTLSVYDVAGNLVTTLASGSYSVGPHSVTWNADASTGLYFVKLTTPDRSMIRKLTLVR